MFELSVGMLNNRIEEAQTYTEEILAQPFDFTKGETLNSDYENLDFASSEAAVKERWRKSASERGRNYFVGT